MIGWWKVAAIKWSLDQVCYQDVRLRKSKNAMEYEQIIAEEWKLRHLTVSLLAVSASL
jgi:hypothetical protein